MKVQTEIIYEPADLSNCFDVLYLDFFGQYTVYGKKPTKKNNENIGNDHFVGINKKLKIYLITIFFHQSDST